MLEELRDAYMAVMEDPDFLAEAEKLGIPIDPARGDKVAEMVTAALNQSPETVRIIAAALGTEAPMESVTSKIISLEDGNKQVGFTGASGDMTGEVSGSRTALTINGAEADRKALAVGMDCTMSYAVAVPIEFATVDCTGDTAKMAATDAASETAPAAEATGDATAKMGGMVQAHGTIAALDDGGKVVTMTTDGGEEVKVSVSGSRTALTVAGSDAKRDALTVGMTCDASYDDANADRELATLACN